MYSISNVSSVAPDAISRISQSNGMTVDQTMRAPASAASTPPESPVEDEIPRNDLDPESGAYIAQGNPNLLLLRNVVYSAADLRAMAETLAVARANGEFPKTSASLMDAKAIVDDFQWLQQLRAARGNPELPPSDRYSEFYVEIARRVQARDALLDDEAQVEEAKRRINSYMRGVEREKWYYHASKTMLQRRGVTAPSQPDFNDIRDQIFSTIEHSVEHTLADATGPIRLNTRLLERQVSAHHIALEQQHMALEQQQTVLKRHHETQALQSQAMDNNLATVSGLVDHLSQFVVNMPQAINEVVNTAVQQQTEVAVREITEALRQERQRSQAAYQELRSRDRDYHSYGIPSRHRNGQKNRMRRMIRRVLGRD